MVGSFSFSYPAPPLNLVQMNLPEAPKPPECGRLRAARRPGRRRAERREHASRRAAQTYIYIYIYTHTHTHIYTHVYMLHRCYAPSREVAGSLERSAREEGPPPGREEEPPAPRGPSCFRRASSEAFLLSGIGGLPRRPSSEAFLLSGIGGFPRLAQAVTLGSEPLAINFSESDS